MLLQAPKPTTVESPRYAERHPPVLAKEPSDQFWGPFWHRSLLGKAWFLFVLLLVILAFVATLPFSFFFGDFFEVLAPSKKVDLSNLAPDPLPRNHFGVWVVVKRRRKRLRDAGVLCLSGGWLHYEGNHFSFDLRPCDVVSVRVIFGEVRLRLTDGSEVRVRVVLEWLNGDTLVRENDYSLEQSIGRWSNSRKIPEGTSTYPPLS